jgi:hypothetical protein
MPDQPRPLPGQPSWTALKQLIESRLDELGHPALTQLLTRRTGRLPPTVG